MSTGTYPNLSNATLFNSSTPYYASSTLPSGIESNLSWTAGPSGTYLASVPVRGLSASSSVVSATVTYANGIVNTTDALNCWLVSSYAGANQLNFQVASLPATPASFCIAWQVLKF